MDALRAEHGVLERAVVDDQRAAPSSALSTSIGTCAKSIT